MSRSLLAALRSAGRTNNVGELVAPAAGWAAENLLAEHRRGTGCRSEYSVAGRRAVWTLPGAKR
jgi:hypothetical protein